ncbi:MAG: ABC transporter permease [Candidatus Cloacimonetes bacterium]|nr:ABC transporter permease [Candidatus Cloacimonadota bacterium]
MFYLKFAVRYLKGRKKILFTFSNMLSLLGIIIGVFSLLVVSSVMNGFDSDMRNRIISLKAEIKLNEKNYDPIRNHDELVRKIEQHPDISGVSPICETELLIQNEGEIASTICFGIDLQKHTGISDVLNKIVIGVPTEKSFSEDGIILGLDLSLSLNVTVGEYVRLSSPLGTEPSPFGLLPKSKKMKVIGLFISGMPEYDKVYTFVSLKNAQYYLGFEDEISYLELRTNNSKKSAVIAKKIQKYLNGEYIVEDWSEFDANLFNAIKMEKIVMFFVLALMIILAAFNMTGNFIKLVAEKKTEIGVLKALGASEKDIIKIFVHVGMIVGIIGTLIGFSFAVLLLVSQQKWHFIKIPVPGFPLQWLPVEIRIADLILVPLITILISFLTTLHPSKKTVKIDPIKIIRK